MAEANWKNRTLFHGDNLGFLRAMNSESVALIATDPPFNKGRDFHATPDSLARGAGFRDRWSWERDVRPEWVDRLTDDFPGVMQVVQGSRISGGDDMGAFLCFLGVRLLEMRRVLAPTGSIYLHCDPTASHYLKALMDAIFGRRNFRNEIIWGYGLGGSSRRLWSRKHDVLFFYTKSKEYHFDKPTMPATSARMQGRQKGMPDYWTDIPAINNMARERTGYPTQKPIALYERIVRASSKRGDIVLDPFCGCATTPVAAERLGRRWVGMDTWDGAHRTVIARLRQEGLETPDGDTGGRPPVAGNVEYRTDSPERTDDGETAIPFLRPKITVREPERK